MLVAENESLKTWNVLLGFIWTPIKHSWVDKVILADQDRGGIDALEINLRVVHQIYFSFHRKENAQKNCGTAN